MNHLTRISSLLVASLAFCGVCIVATAAPKSVDLPPDMLMLKPSALPGFEKAQTNCVACHSAEYMLYQPPTAGRAYWDAMAKRMKTVFKAPIDDADIPVIVDYLVKTYGNEQPK